MRFTVETAVAMGKRSAELAKQRKLDKEQQRALILADPPLPAQLSTDYSIAKAERTRKQIELIDQMIEQSDDADVLDALTRSKERLFRIWAHLAGLPGPGQLKPVQPRAKPTWQPTIAPLPAQPSTPQVVSTPQPSVVPVPKPNP